MEQLFLRLPRILLEEHTRLSEKHAKEELFLLVHADSWKVYPHYDEICQTYQAQESDNNP